MIICWLIITARKIVKDGLQGVEGVSIASSGGMFVVVDIKPLGIAAKTFAEGLLKDEGVSVLPCAGFGRSCENNLRLSVVLEEKRLKEAVDRIGRYVKNLVSN